jgi:hypothetical protein
MYSLLQATETKLRSMGLVLRSTLGENRVQNIFVGGSVFAGIIALFAQIFSFPRNLLDS